MATANDFTLSFGVLTAGQAGEMVFTRPSAQYDLHSLTLGFAGGSEAMDCGVKSSSETKVVYTFTPPLHWCEALPESVSGRAVVTGKVSFDSAVDGLDNAHVCTLSQVFTFYVPESLRPVVSLRTSVVYGNEVAQEWGTPLRGISRLGYEVTASTPAGTVLTACRLTCGPQELGAVDGELPPFTAAGTFTPTARVTDSRGRSAEGRSDAVTVWEYFPPTLSGVSVLRCTASGTADSSGRYLKVRAVARCAAVDGRNSVTLSVRLRPVGNSWGSPIILTTGEEMVLPIAGDGVWEAQFTAVDTVGNAATCTAISGTAAVAFHLRDGGGGAAFGKRAEADGFHCGWDAHFDGQVTAAGKVTAASLQVGGKSLLDLTYPVGSVYMSFAAASPATLFGGTWIRLESRFLLGGSSTYAPGSTGGSAVRTLTEAQLPVHSHEVVGYTDAENVGHDHSVPNVRIGQSGEYGAYAETWGYGTDSRDLTTDYTDITHNHRVDITSQTAGAGEAFSVLPPYIAVYMWRRTA